jgi:hypothetical protein
VKRVRLLPLLIATGLLISLLGCGRALTPPQAAERRLPAGSPAPQPFPAEERLAGEPPSERGDDGLLTQAAFANAMARRVQLESPGWEVLNQGDEVLELWQGDRPGLAVPVMEAYEAYRERPQEAEQVIAEAIARAKEFDRVAGDWSAVRSALLPRLVNAKRAGGLREARVDAVAIRVADDLYLLLELTLPHGPILVTTDLQLRWNQPLTTLFAAAAANLNSRTPPPTRPTELPIWVWHEKDGYDAARMVLLGRLEELARETEGRLVVAAPSQHVLYAFDGGNEQIVGLMQAICAADFERLPDPLTRQWLALDGERLVLFEAGGLDEGEN